MAPSPSRRERRPTPSALSLLLPLSFFSLTPAVRAKEMEATVRRLPALEGSRAVFAPAAVAGSCCSCNRRRSEGWRPPPPPLPSAVAPGGTTRRRRCGAPPSATTGGGVAIHRRRWRFDLGGAGFRLRYRSSAVDPFEDPPDGEGQGFDGAVPLFNDGDYHSCHDVLEEIWYGAEEPTRTLVHGILQCTVGLHYYKTGYSRQSLRNSRRLQEKVVGVFFLVEAHENHRGAMMELGEGLCKLRKMDFDQGPFLRFEREISEALEFLYQTQKELAAYNWVEA